MPEDTKNPMDSLMEIFMLETNGFLSTLEGLLMDSEKREGGIIEATPEIFRIMHTIKSSSAMMNLEEISRLAHKVEDLFYYLREHPATEVNAQALTDILLDAADFIKGNLDGQGREDPSAQIQRIQSFLEDLKGKAKAVPMAAEGKLPAPASGNKENFVVWFRRECPMLGMRAFELLTRVRKAMPSIDAIPEDPSEAEQSVREQGLILLVPRDVDKEALLAMLEKSPFVGRVAQPQSQAVQGGGGSTASQEPVRTFTDQRRESPTFGKSFANVEIAKLDNLVDLVGQILIQQMELARDIEQQDYEHGKSAVMDLKKLILKLQEATLSTRMIPVRDTFLKMQRLVRDMSRKQGKEIDFIISGEGTEVDRSIVDHMDAPLMHLLRNAIDHGIESPEQRQAQGKPAAGRLELLAYTEGRNVVIAISDDGQGFNTEGILEKALNLGLVTQAQAMEMTKDEIHSLTFVQGFSTNNEVTEYSGRGVGMDVVHDNMRKMNGKVSVRSERGQGTRILLKIPLTLAIMDTLLLRVGEEVCAIPVSAVRKILFMGQEDSVRRVNGEDMALLKGKCYRILNLFDFYSHMSPIPYEEGILIIIGGELEQYVVFASEIMDRQDVVVKPAPQMFQFIRGISGCTILGDGRISLILDTDELLSAASKKGV